jgi:hypothetical protein
VTDLPRITYITMDPVGESVGTSQVARYLIKLAERDVQTALHSFERVAPPPSLVDQLGAAGVRWTRHPFGTSGSRGGLSRLARAAVAARGAELTHARSDLAAAAASFDDAPFVWDMRAFFADQRIVLGTLAAGGREDRILRRLERRVAHRASAIVTLAETARPVLADRHGSAVAANVRVITTAVDLALFPLAPLPPVTPRGFLLAGTMNAYYDVPLMLALVGRSRERQATSLRVAAPGSSPWDSMLAGADERVEVAPGSMPSTMAACHVGLSVCRDDAGVSLTAAMPTKLGELLATGRPVVVNPGLGDMDHILEAFGCGVALRAGQLDDALDQLDALLADPATPDRCRAAAAAHFDLDTAVDSLIGIYRTLATTA